MGILILLLLTAGTASAQTFYLTDVNDNTYDGLIKIKVTYDGNTITVQDVSSALDGTSNVDVKAIGIVNSPDNSVVQVTDNSGKGSIWTIAEGDFNKAGFGDFSTMCTKNNNVKTRGPIVLQLENSFSNLQKNADGNSIIVHISFGEEGKDLLVGSTWTAGSTEIPEFPTVALPVAAILGLMFIFGRRKQE
jgi:hypothetical protein